MVTNIRSMDIRDIEIITRVFVNVLILNISE